MLKDVFSYGDEEASGQRIAVALIKAQELGFELPPAISNFSAGQLRLQNTMDEMTNLSKELQNAMVEISNRTFKLETYSDTSMNADWLALTTSKTKEGVEDDLDRGRGYIDSKEVFLTNLGKTESAYQKAINNMVSKLEVDSISGEYGFLSTKEDMIKLFSKDKDGIASSLKEAKKRAEAKQLKLDSLTQYCNIEELKKEYMNLFQEKTKKEDIDNFYNKVEEISKKMLKNQLADYRKMQINKEVSDKDKKAAEEKIYETYKVLSMNAIPSDIMNRMNIMLQEKPLQAKIEKDMKPYFEINKELEPLYKAYREAEKHPENAAAIYKTRYEFIQKYSNTLQIQFEADYDECAESVKKYKEHMNSEEYKTTKDSFAEVMGEVILGNKWTSIKNLGIGGIKYAWNLLW